jgi:hypothetical protein
MQMTEPMNEERANQMLTDAMGYDATDLARALGYLERVEQEKTIIDSFKARTCLELETHEQISEGYRSGGSDGGRAQTSNPRLLRPMPTSRRVPRRPSEDIPQPI